MINHVLCTSPHHGGEENLIIVVTLLEPKIFTFLFEEDLFMFTKSKKLFQLCLFFGHTNGIVKIMRKLLLNLL